MELVWRYFCKFSMSVCFAFYLKYGKNLFGTSLGSSRYRSKSYTATCKCSNTKNIIVAPLISYFKRKSLWENFVRDV